MVRRRLYTFKAFHEDYGVGRTKAYELIGAGEIEAVKVGSRRLITGDSAEAYYQRLVEAARAKAA